LNLKLNLETDANKEICTCAHISVKEIEAVILKHSVTTLGELQDLTGAGAHCRNCLFRELDSSLIPKGLYLNDVLKIVKQSH